jgi:hypothetical protein
MREASQNDESESDMKIIQPKIFNPGDRTEISKEEKIVDVKFNIHKFNSRIKPNNKDIVIICCFSEFGCESVGAMYCLPKLIKHFVGKYIIIAGWYGREYLYKHLADEYWEMKEEFQWLREYARAFHHESRNLKAVEKNLAKFGNCIPSSYVGMVAIGNNCNSCTAHWGDVNYHEKCVKCGSANIVRSIFGDIPYWRPKAVRIPLPPDSVMAKAEEYVKPNAVGIFARGRKCYGRNLTPEFYAGLIERLESMGYNPVWLGEKQSVQACPVKHITDFSRLPESKNLELTLAIISKCEFTVQFWTASTRLAAMVGTPYLLFESPDQLFGAGQEGYRLQLTTFGNRKIVLSDFLHVYNDTAAALDLVERSVKEMKQGNWRDIIGMVADEGAVAEMINGSSKKLGW